MQWLPSCWCLLCRITCRFDTCLHCTSLAMLARTSMAGATRTHTFRALLLCVGSSSSAPTRKGGVYVWRLRPQLSLLLHQFGVEPCALCIADYNNHICICFVLFCFVLFCFVLLFFHFFSFSRGHNWDIIPASRHNICLVQLRYCIFTYGIIYFIVQFVLCRSLTPFMDLFSEPLFI